MQSVLNPYVSFKTNARQAMEFYKSVFGGKLTIATFKDYQLSQNPSEDNLVMHAELEAENGIKFMAADTPAHMEYNPGTNISMSLSGEDLSELKGYYDKLSASGTVTQPLEKAPWGDTFGMCTDKFGINWMVNVTAPK